MSRRQEIGWALALASLALTHRLLFMHSNIDASWPFSIFYEGDGEAYFHFARAILAGQMYQDGLPFHPPGFAYFLAALHQLLGVGGINDQVPHTTVRALLAAVGSMSVGLLFLLTRPYLGTVAAVITSLLCIYHFGLYILAVSPVTEGLYLSAYLLAWVWFTRALAHPLQAHDEVSKHPHLHGIGLGLLCGALALTRAEAMALPLVFIGIGLIGRWRGCSAPAPLGTWLALLLAFGIALLPWTLHNRQALSELNSQLLGQIDEPLPTFVPITVYGPLNLALANNADADGTFSRDLMSSARHTGNLDLRDPQHLQFVLHGDDMALAWIRAHPADFVGLIGDKWALASRALTLGWTQWNWPGGLRGVRQPVDVFTPDRDINRPIMVALFIIGLVACWRAGGGARKWLGVVLAGSLIAALSTTLFFGYVRQGLLLLPLGFSLAGAALARLVQAGSLYKEAAVHQRTAIILSIIVAALFILELTGVNDHRNYQATGTNIVGSNKLNRDQPVRIEVMVDE